MTDGPTPPSSKWSRWLKPIGKGSVRATGWGLKKTGSLLVGLSKSLGGRYRDSQNRTAPATADATTDPAADSTSESGASSSFYQKTFATLKRWGSYLAKKIVAVGRRLFDYAMTVGQYYWSNGNAIKAYLLDFDPNFRSTSTSRKEIILDADRPQVGGVFNGESWEIELPECCVVCGKPTREERNSEVRLVEHYRRPVWIVIGCWAAGFLWAILSFRFSYLLIGLAGGLALGHRFREFVTVRIRYQRCRDHLQRIDLPTLRAFGHMLIVGTGHKSVRQQFVDLAQGLQIGAMTQYAGSEMTPVEPAPEVVDRTPIPLVDDIEGDSPILHHGSDAMPSVSTPPPVESKSDVYISVPDAPERKETVSKYYRKTLNDRPDVEPLPAADRSSASNQAAAPLADAHAPLSGSGSGSSIQHPSEGYLAGTDSGESYALRELHSAEAGQGTPAALQRSDYQRQLMWQESPIPDNSPWTKSKLTLGKVLQGCFDVEHVLAEALMMMLVVYHWCLLAGLCYVAYLNREIVLDGNKQTLLIYAVINVSLSGLFAFSLGWGTLYILTVGIGCAAVAFQEHVLPDVAREWLRSRLTLETVDFELILISTIPLLLMIIVSFLRSLSSQCGNLMWISRRAAWEEKSIRSATSPLGDLSRAATVVLWSLFPAILGAGAIAYLIDQQGWTIEQIRAHRAFWPGVAVSAAFSLIYIPIGLSVAGVTGTTNPFRVVWWMLRAPIDYLACYAVVIPYYVMGTVMVGAAYYALSQRQFLIGNIEGGEFTIWLCITMSLGLLQFPLIALSHMFGLVALKNEPRLHWKGTA